MLEEISRSDKRNEQLRKEGKVITLDSSEDIKSMWRFYELMEEVRIDSKYKSEMSERSASKIPISSYFNSI